MLSSRLRRRCVSLSSPLLHAHWIRRTVSTSSCDPSSSWVIVYGGNGSLGQSMIKRFGVGGWKTISVDYYDNHNAAVSIKLMSTHTHQLNVETTCDAIRDAMSEGAGRVGAVVHTAGGWRAGHIGEHVLNVMETMHAVNTLSAVSAAVISAQFKPRITVFTGAAAARHATPNMIAYGMSKAAVHQLVTSLAADPAQSTVAALLPITIDTDTNRAVMPNADFSQWTPLNVLADTVYEWATATSSIDPERQLWEERMSGPPVNGGMYEFITADGKTQIKLAGAGAN